MNKADDSVSAPALPPRTLEEALVSARALLTEADREVLRTSSQEEAGWRLHFTLGHTLRHELKLWSSGTWPLFDDLTDKVPGHLVLDADAASAALIATLWLEERANAGEQ
ncbi:DUF6794 domain-containing protein [Roseateles sp. So40a]|uniref:DUF6794 domain-containing protein n=1 Tax=Roseateles sp. So40a TaxID=3400226 RepID=UPI003A8704EB